MSGGPARAERRRREKAARKRPLTRVGNRIAAVPIEHCETYYRHEILSEGPWASGRHFILIRPSIDAGRKEADWFDVTLGRMHETRRRKGTLPAVIDMPDGTAAEIDVGMIDITVFFETPPNLPPLPATREEADQALTENLRHLDLLCEGALHDQMLIGSVMHIHRADGSLQLHFHNLIFGLRQEVRGDMDILNPLDIQPLMNQLARSGPVGFIGGFKPAMRISEDA